MKCVHWFAQHRKNINTMSEIKNMEGEIISSHKGISSAGKDCFFSIFKEKAGFPFTEF